MSKNGIRRYCTEELQRMVDGTDQLASLLDALDPAITSPLLRTTLGRQREALVRRHRTLEACLTLLGHPFASERNEEVHALCEAGRRGLATRDADLRDVQIAHAATRVEAWELATYTALASWFRQLRLDEVADRLDAVVRELQAAERELAEVRDSLTGVFEADEGHALERGHERTPVGSIVHP